jgi:hypothetical protein
VLKDLSLPLPNAWPPSPVLLPPPCREATEDIFSDRDNENMTRAKKLKLSPPSSGRQPPKEKERVESMQVEGIVAESPKKRDSQTAGVGLAMEIDENSVSKGSHNIPPTITSSSAFKIHNQPNTKPAYVRNELSSPFVPSLNPATGPVTQVVPDFNVRAATSSLPHHHQDDGAMDVERVERRLEVASEPVVEVYKTRNDPNYKFELTVQPRSEKVALLMERARQAIAKDVHAVDKSKFDLDLKGTSESGDWKWGRFRFCFVLFGLLT